MKLSALTQLSRCFDVNIVKARTNPDNYAEAFKLFKVIPGQRDGVVEKSSHCLIQNLQKTDAS